MSSIIVYIRSMLSLNLTKYKLLYCSKKSTNIISCYYNFTTIADEKKRHNQMTVSFQSYLFKLFTEIAF